MSDSADSNLDPKSAIADEHVAEIADRFVRLMRSFTRLRSQFLAAAQSNVEWSAHLLINSLVLDGPMRASALAEVVQSDPSTVSRQVASLVKDGLVTRLADPEDGRASLLIATETGHQVYRDHADARTERYARMLEDWSEADLKVFAQLLGRFSEAMGNREPFSYPVNTTSATDTSTEGTS